MTLDEFAQQQKLAVVVRDRHLPPGDPLRFYATFAPPMLLVEDDGSLFACYGNGVTPDEARSALWAEIQGKRMVKDGGGVVDVAIEEQRT